MLLAIPILVSCHKEDFEDEAIPQCSILDREPIAIYPGTLYVPDDMSLGERLANPYSLSNMRNAYDSISAELVDAGIERDDITTTHFYVRFKPENEEALRSIKANYADFEIYEYPLDYELSGRVSYHDPAIPDSLPTYQYASIDSLSWVTIPVPQNVEFEILERLFIPDEDIDDSNISVLSCGTTSYNDAVEALVNRSLLLTGNLDEEEDAPENGTMVSNSTWYPSGRITAYDDILNAQVPLEGVKVRVRRWFTTRTAMTDANGYFAINKGFKNKVNYLIVWEGSKWDIRDGLFGQAYYNGPKKQGEWNLEITDDGKKSIRYAAIHRAVYRMKKGNTYGISRINDSFTTKIAYIHNSFDNISGMYWLDAGCDVLPDILIFGKNKDDSLRTVHQIISTTFHELGHASHFTNAPHTYAAVDMPYIESWASFVGYYLSLKEYQDLGRPDGPFLYESVMEANHTIIEFCKPDKIINRQLSMVQSGSKYTPLFIDLYDNDNQWRLYNYYTAYDNSLNRDFLPKDYIRAIPANVLENFTFSSYRLSQIKTKLMQFYRGNTDVVNAEYNLTIDNINLMFNLYENL